MSFFSDFLWDFPFKSIQLLGALGALAFYPDIARATGHGLGFAASDASQTRELCSETGSSTWEIRPV